LPFPRDLKTKVSGLNTGGTTALGPALALCVGMASNFPMAEVILCTDGVSNVGVGKLGDSSPDTGFYLTVSGTLTVYVPYVDSVVYISLIALFDLLIN